MPKMLRNTIFTAVALGLLAVGINWNRQVAKPVEPLASEQTVLATERLDLADDPTFPLTVSFTRQAMKLGQTQEMVVRTVPDAEIDIVTIYPTGSINNGQTFRAKADSTGEYRTKFKLSDFHYLGLFQTTAIAISGNKTAQTRATFVLKSWSPEDKRAKTDANYLYPLVP